MATTCAACANAATTTCSMCQVSICAEHTRRGYPLITARQLATVTATTATRAPKMLGEILFREIEQVDYCEDCREVVAERRQSEQMKFLLGMLLVIALVVGVPVLLMLL